MRASETLRGFALAVFSIPRVISQSLSEHQETHWPTGIDFYVYEDTSEPAHAIYIHPSERRQETTPPALTQAQATSGLHFSSQLTVANRELTLIARPGPTRYASMAWESFAVLFVGLALTALLAWAVANATRKAHSIAELVRRRTAELSDLQLRQQAILDGVVDGIITIDSAGNIETFNASAERIFGYRSVDIVGKNISLLIPAFTSETSEDGFLHRLTADSAHAPRRTAEVEALRSDGSTFTADLGLAEMQLAGRTVFNGVIRDITERKTHPPDGD